MLATTRRMIRIRMMRMMSMVRMVRMVSLVRICEFSEEDEDRTAIRTSFWFDRFFRSVGTWFFLISFLVKVMITRCPRPVSCISWIKEWELIRSGLAEQAFGISLVTRVGGFHADLVVRFLTPKSWTDLGGSKQAAEYLGDVDEEGVQGKEKNQSKIPQSWRSSTVAAFWNPMCFVFPLEAFFYASFVGTKLGMIFFDVAHL